MAVPFRTVPFRTVTSLTAPLLVVTFLAVTCLGLASSPVGAEPPGAPVSEVPAPAHIASALSSVVVSSPAYSQARTRAQAAMASLATNQRRLEAAFERSVELAGTRDDLEGKIDRDVRVKTAADAQVRVLRIQLRQLALQAYIGGDDRSSQDAQIALDQDAYLAARRTVSLREAVTSAGHDEYVEQLGIAARARARLDANRSELARIVKEIAVTASEVSDSNAAIRRDRAAVVTARERVDDTRATATVDGTDLPLVALDAYVRGAAIAQLVTPACNMHWSLLAGIGKIESGQGTHGGASLRRDGTLTRPITGIALDGSHGTEVIRTGDGAFMRAQGPMQFLPSTWSAVAVDGDDDGARDIQNLYDAAATAAAYLCRNGVDVATPGGLRAAILSYNFSGEYVANVTRAMRGYAEALPDLATG